MDSPPFVSRIAPTPSGYLHLGNAYNFLLTWLLVKQHRGVLWLRIDDSDAPRIRQEYVDDIFYTLDWLGISWDKGPQQVEEQQRYSQRQRIATYELSLQKLKDEQHVFACTCSRSDLANTLLYPETCLHQHLPFEEHAWRMITPKHMVSYHDFFSSTTRHIDLYQHMRHPVLKRKDGIPAYQLASVIDDIDMGITAVVRGIDLELSTATQLVLAQQLNKPSFNTIQFYHHPLLTDEYGNKLSKSQGSFCLREYREHHTKQELYASFARWLNFSFEGDTLTDLQNCFNAARPF